MKNLILAISMAVASCTVIRCAADLVSTNADYVAGVQSTALITPELRAAAGQLFGSDAARQLIHAVELNMTKYDRDMATDSGRRAWHGRLLREEISTNDLCKVSVYTNEVTGKVWRYRQPFKPVTVAKVNARLKTSITNGIPESLAQARRRRDAEKNVTSNVVVNVEANK